MPDQLALEVERPFVVRAVAQDGTVVDEIPCRSDIRHGPVDGCWSFGEAVKFGMVAVAAYEEGRDHPAAARLIFESLVPTGRTYG